ncbi:MAG TPA: stage V sporulation protein AB [Tissierellaceae bacterium]|nr:stage V sporulation protein AB [Tissierellaceae bacterium]
MIGNVVVVLIALGGGAVAGAALSAFITLIKLIPQMSQMTETQKSIKTYEIVFTIGTVIFTIAYFSDSNLGLSKIIAIIIGTFIGIFVGLFSSALAEVLNIIPILTKKLGMREEINYIIYVLLFGRLVGSVYYWIYF